MNYIYFGSPQDLNIGNGKSVSDVAATIDQYLADETQTIFSNIVLKGVPFVRLTPDKMDEVLETENALVILDEIHAIVHKNHHVSESCQRHEVLGLCYKLSEFFRQVRKREITTRSTAQDFWDVQKQLRDLMQVKILCEKFHNNNGNLVKCEPETYPSGDCPKDHEHWILQSKTRDMIHFKKIQLLDPAPYYDLYDSYEIVKGWVYGHCENPDKIIKKPKYAEVDI